MQSGEEEEWGECEDFVGLGGSEGADRCSAGLGMSFPMGINARRGIHHI